MRVLGIETSCDETGIAIYDSEQGLIAHQIYSQIETHAAYGGVVPELASRDHIRKTLPLIKNVLQEVPCSGDALSGIAYTKGPGLIGALMVGASLACSLSFAWNIPLIGIHHLEAHLMAVMLEEQHPTYPFLALIVSGGHTLLVEVDDFARYTILGESLDDAVGEAFDKTAKLLGLGYPGGAALARLAEKGTLHRYHFPRPLLNKPGLDFSFSGLKTHTWHCYETSDKSTQTKADIAWAFEDAVIETLVAKSQRALLQTKLPALVVVGGVGANKKLRHSLHAELAPLGIKTYFPRIEFCTDNGAMVAYAGHERLVRGFFADPLAITVKPRWSLEEIEKN